jgi:dihydroxyacid dehydratase/phosphogluconate dehydratase
MRMGYTGGCSRGQRREAGGIKGRTFAQGAEEVADLVDGIHQGRQRGAVGQGADAQRARRRAGRGGVDRQRQTVHPDLVPLVVGRVAALVAEGGIAVLRGNLAPGGALIKPAAASPHLLQHRGRAVVLDSIEDFHTRIDDPALDVDADSVLVLRGCGPKGYPGMPEVSNMPLPTKLLEQDVRDMVRICDGRMSGTAYGTVVSVDVPARRIDLEVPADVLAARRPNEATVAGFANPRRGWERLYVDHVLQADTGADLDFLIGSSGSAVSRVSH